MLLALSTLPAFISWAGIPLEPGELACGLAVDCGVRLLSATEVRLDAPTAYLTTLIQEGGKVRRRRWRWHAGAWALDGESRE